jgi:hypothetical protein
LFWALRLTGSVVVLAFSSSSSSSPQAANATAPAASTTIPSLRITAYPFPLF